MSCETPSTRIEEIEKKLASSSTPIDKRRCIYKVHKQLRDVNVNAYKPVLLAIGPFNDHVEVGEGFIEQHKWRYLRQLLKRTEASVEEYITTLRGLEEEARKCYVECNVKTDEFVEMMLLDGCFIIELFRKFQDNSKDENDPIFRMKWVLPRIARDLLLLENQLPFFVLAKLFEMSKRGSSRTSLTVLALGFFYWYLPFRWNATNYNSKHKIESLLCLTHKAQPFSLRRMVMGRLELGLRLMNEDFKHLLGLIHASISISMLDTEINNAIEPHEEVEKAEIFKHVFCLISEAVSQLVAKMKNMRNPEGGEGYSEYNMPKTDQDKEREFSHVRSELKKVRVKRAAAPAHEIEGCGSADGYTEDNMPKTDQDREMELIQVRSELKEVRVEITMAAELKDDVNEIKGWGSDHGYYDDNLPKNDQDRERELIPARSELKKVRVKRAAAPAYEIEGWGSDDGYSEDNMPKTNQDREMELSPVLPSRKATAPMNDGYVSCVLEECRVLDEHSEDNMPKTDQDRVKELNSVLPSRKVAAAPMNDGYVSCATEECRGFDGHSEFNMPKTDLDRQSELICSELKKAKEEFKKDFSKIKHWEYEFNAPCASELFEAGIEFEKAKKFMVLVRHHEHQMSIPYRKFLCEAGVEIKKAIKFMDLLALKKIKDLNIHSATELEEAGIEFKESAKDKKSKEEKMFCIKFNKGKMEVSPLSIEDQTETCFRNLIAYEEYSCDEDNDFNCITDYVCFMDRLIDSPKDVQLLCDKGIIQNYLGDDEVVAKMVNKLGHNINISTCSSIYARTSKEVNMHCRKRRNRWMAKLRHDYFNTPWAWISFLAAVLLLGLTIVQTIFCIIS